MMIGNPKDLEKRMNESAEYKYTDAEIKMYEENNPGDCSNTKADKII